MDKILINKIKDFLSKEDNKSLCGKPATEFEISTAEKQLNITFSQDYKEFINFFGGSYAGIAIHAFSNGKLVGKETVVDLTLALRQSHPEVQDTYVISDDGSGNPIMVNSKGQVSIYYHDSGEIEILSSSLGEYIEEVFEPW